MWQGQPEQCSSKIFSRVSGSTFSTDQLNSEYSLDSMTFSSLSNRPSPRMRRDKITHAYIRNRAENSNLQSELQRIEREQQDEMRILNTERRRFRTKYSKLSSLPVVRSANPPEGPIYETHEPGFRHPRKIEAKPVGESDSSTDFEKIREMVFTDGSVDIEKIACLHLVSAYRTETLSPPKRRAKACKEHSPTERLIDRSKKGYLNNEKVSSILPLYTVEPIELGAMGEQSNTVIRDGRLAARILINKNIRELIGTVLGALEISNHDKLARLTSLANNPGLLREIFEKKHIQDFVSFLSQLPLVNHYESFVLTPPFKMKSRDLNIKTSTGSIEALVKNIRQNVLQLPTRKHITTVADEKPIGLILEPKRDVALRSTGQWRVERISKHQKEPFHENELNRISHTRSGRRFGRLNFINKNIKNASKVRKIEYDTDEAEEVLTTKNSVRSSFFKLNIKKNGSPLTAISEGSGSENAMEEETLLKVTSPRTGSTEITAGQESKSTDEKLDNWKYHIKRNSCPACKEKWKTPLPSPKTPRVKKSSVLPAAENQLFKTDSIHRIDMLINKELYALESYDRRFSTTNGSFRRGSREKKVATVNIFRHVDLSSIDLARIEQEIKEKETQRKLEIFLSEHASV